MYRRSTAHLYGFLALACALSACAATENSQAQPPASQSTYSSDGGTLQATNEEVFEPYEEMLKDYTAQAFALDWPAGFTQVTPSDPGIMENPDGTQSPPLFQDGYGANLALSDWECAWQIRAVEQGTKNFDALKKLGEYNNSARAKKFSDSTWIDYMNDIIKSANAADFGPLRQHVSENCSEQVIESMKEASKQ